MSCNESVQMPIEQTINNPTSSSGQGIQNIHRTDHAIIALEHMRTLGESKHFFDIVLIAGIDGKRVPAHRLVLSASSPYFSAMFSGSMREAKQHEVTLHEVRGDILEAIVEFCYSGRIQLQQDTVEMLMMTASMFQMDSMVTECANYLVELLDPFNCLGIIFIADQLNCKDLQKKAIEYTREKFMQVCKNYEFSFVSVKHLAKIIASDDVNVSSEEDIFHSIMKWVNFKLSEREQHIPELLSWVRMTQLSLSFIADHVVAVCRSNDCQDLLTTENTEPRNSTGTMFAIGVTENCGSIHIECYCPRLEKWTLWNTEMNNRAEFGVATIGDNLLILGGISGTRVLSSVVKLNFTTLVVSDVIPMKNSCCGLCVEVLESGDLYVIGGRNNSHYLDAVSRWNRAERCWEYVAFMSNERVYAASAVLNGCIYVVGGFNGSGCLRSVESYDPLTNTWTERASLSVARQRFGVSVFNGVLYAVGGVNKNGVTSTVECYNSVADKWTMIEPLRVVRGALACTFFGKRLMVTGGLRSNVEEYDTESRNWSKKLSLTRNYHSVAIFVVQNRYMLNLSSLNKPQTFKFAPEVRSFTHGLAQIARRRAAQLNLLANR